VQSSIRATKRGAIGRRVYDFGFKMAHRGQIFLAGLRPAPPDPRSGTGCAGRAASALVWRGAVRMCTLVESWVAVGTTKLKACLSGRMRRVVQCLRWRSAEVAGSDCRQAGRVRLQDCSHRLGRSPLTSLCARFAQAIALRTELN
jgi:hypothetical protein